MKRQASRQWAALAVALAATLSLSALHLSGVGGCGGEGGGGEEEGGEEEGSGGGVESSVVAMWGAGDAVSSVTQSVMSNLSQQTGLRVAALKAQAAPEGMLCALSPESTTTSLTMTCTCPGGGTTIISYEQTWTPETCPIEGEEEMIYSVNSVATSSTVFYDCIMEACGEEITLNGEDNGSWVYSSECDGSWAFAGGFRTAAQCSGITITVGNDTLAVGYERNFDGSSAAEEETVSGSFCTDPPGLPSGLVTFNSQEELTAAIDPEGACEAAAE